MVEPPRESENNHLQFRYTAQALSRNFGSSAFCDVTAAGNGIFSNQLSHQNHKKEIHQKAETLFETSIPSLNLDQYFKIGMPGDVLQEGSSQFKHQNEADDEFTVMRANDESKKEGGSSSVLKRVGHH